MKIILVFELIQEIVKYLLLVHVLFKTEIRRKWFMGVTVAVYAFSLLTGILSTENVGKISHIIGLIVAIILMVVMELPIINRILDVFKTLFIVSCIDSAIATLLDLIEEYGISVKVPEEINWVISNTISVSVLLMICWIRKRQFMKNSRGFQIIKKVVIHICIAILAVALPFTVVGLSYMSGKVDNLALIITIRILSVIFMFSIIALVIFIVYINDTNKKMKSYLETEKTLKENQKNYYEAMLSRENDTRRFRHDVLNHLIAVNELAKQGEMAAVINYVEEMQGDIVKIQQKCYSVGNIIIDTFLNYYVQMLDDDVEVNVIGCLNKEVSISDVELCTIFSNLIKNSVEELKKQSEGKKYLKIKVNSGQQAFQIEISNSISNQIKVVKSGLPRTTKKDKKKHGFGLRNVKETVEKNQGTFRWEVEESSFNTVVTLPLEYEK